MVGKQMLKLFYKTILIACISGSMTTMNTVAFASSTEKSAVTRDANGVMSTTEKTTLDETASWKDDVLSSITMLAIGALTTRMLLNYRPITLDVKAAAVGGALFVAGEISSNNAFNNKMDEKTYTITKKNDGKTDDNQIKDIQALRDSYEDAKKSVNTKIGLQQSAAYAFGAAAAIAAYLSYSDEVQNQACNSALKTAKTGLETCNKTYTSEAAAHEAASSAALASEDVPLSEQEAQSAIESKKEATACVTCGRELADYQVHWTKMTLESKKLALSFEQDHGLNPLHVFLDQNQCLKSTGTSAKNIAKISNQVCKSSLKSIMKNETVNPKPTTVFNNNNFLESIFSRHNVVTSIEKQSRISSAFEQFASLLIAKADATWMPFITLGTGALASYVVISKALGAEIDLKMYSPINRAIVFAALGGLAYGAAESSKNIVKNIDDRLKKIDATLAELKHTTDGIKLNDTSLQQISLVPFDGNTGGSSGGGTNGSKTSSCLNSSGNTNCPSMTNQLANMPGFSDLPNNFQNISSQIAGVGDSLGGKGNLSGTGLASANALGSNYNAIKSLLKSTQSKLNDTLAANGKPKIDFDREQNNLLKSLNASTAKALSSSGMTAASFMASTGISPISAEKTASNAPVKAPIKTDAVGGGASSGSAKEKDFNLDFKEAAGPAVADESAAALAAKNEKFDIGNNDINTDSGESIFQVISNRYLKSGYPKLLEEIPAKK